VLQPPDFCCGRSFSTGLTASSYLCSLLAAAPKIKQSFSDLNVFEIECILNLVVLLIVVHVCVEVLQAKDNFVR